MLLLSLVAIYEPEKAKEEDEDEGGPQSLEYLRSAVENTAVGPLVTGQDGASASAGATSAEIKADLDRKIQVIDKLIFKIKTLGRDREPKDLSRPSLMNEAENEAARLADNDGVINPLSFKDHAAAIKVQEIFRRRREARLAGGPLKPGAGLVGAIG